MFIIILIMFLRSSTESYEKGVLSDENYEYGKKRSLISMKMCGISWLIELVFSSCWVLVIALPALVSIAINYARLTYIHYPDCICMSVIIPLAHLLNNEETKGVIAKAGWYQGLRYMLGIHNSRNANQVLNQNNERNSR